MNILIKQTSCILLALLVMLSGLPSAVLSYAQKSTRDTVKLSAEFDDIEVFVEAEEGAFPDGACLSVEPVSVLEQDRVDKAVEAERAEDINVAKSHTFDIKVLDADGSEIQPAEGKSVEVSFRSDTVSDDNLDTQVYHIQKDENSALSAEPLNVVSKGDTATVETDGFSYYTVEFTYGDKQYVLPGEGHDIALAYLLKEIGLEGEIEDARVSDPSLVYVGKEFGTEEWRVATIRAFTSEEWLKVILDGIEYEIKVTDSILPGTTTEGETSFASNAPIATVTIDKSKLMDINNIAVEDITDTRVRVENGFIVARDVKLPANDGAGDEVDLGQFSIRYKEAAVMSDGTRKDLLVRYNITVMSRTGITTDYTVSLNIMGPAGKGLEAAKTGIAPCIATKHTAGTSSGYTRAGLRLDVDQDKGFYRIVDRGTKTSRIDDDETFFFTGYGYNIGNYNNSSNPDFSANEVILGAETNRNWAESIILSGGLSMESDIYVPAAFVCATAGDNELFADYYSAGGRTRPGASSPNPPNTDETYVSGFATVVKANSLKTTNRSYYPTGGGAVHDWVFTDGITHNYTSSSGYYGKIELWTDGKIDEGTDSTSGTKLYGGRFVKNGSAITIDEKRTYDVAYGKTVTYKMMPESGYIINNLYIDGAKIDNTDLNFNVEYKADGFTPDYYTYTFPGDEVPGDLSEPGFDPTTGKGGSAHTIHVTWQPTVNLDFYKNWNDNKNMYGVRPTKLPIELQQNGTEYNAAIQTLSKELYYGTISRDRNISVPRSQPYDLTGGADAAKWQYKSPRDNLAMYRMMPMYSDYNEVTNDGTLYKYSVKEYADTGGLLNKYYTQRKPHSTKKEDTDITQTFLANNERPYDTGTTNGYTESNLPKGIARDITYEIDNDLKLTELMVEKEVIAGGTDKGSFDFIAKLTNSDIPGSADPTLPDGITRISGSDFKTESKQLAGDSFVKDGNQGIFSTSILPYTDYKVVEKEQEDWVETTRSKTQAPDTRIGETYTEKIFGFYISETDKLYVYKNGSLYEQDGTTPAVMPTWANVFPSATVNPRIRYFDNHGLEMETGGNTGAGLSGYKYKGDGRDVPAAAVTNMVTVTYADAASFDSTVREIVFKATKSGDNGITEAEDLIISRRAHRAWFQNRELEDLTIKKEVFGNQASRDKYFKMHIEISKANDVDYVTLDMTKADSNFNGGHAIDGNAATTHDASSMNAANGKDQVANDILYTANDYEVIKGDKNVDDIHWYVGASTQQIALNGGAAEFDIYLQHGQEVKIVGLPIDARYKVTETPEDYKPSVSIDSGDAKTGDELKNPDDVSEGRKTGSNIDTTGTKTWIEDSNITEDTTVLFENRRKGTIPTEVRVPMVLGGLLLILMSLEWLILRYRNRRREAYYEE